MALDGAWDLTISTPMGEQKATLNLTTDGGTLNGSLSSPQGTQEFTGSVEGDSFSWTSTVSGPMGQLDLAWSGALSGDEIAGNVQFGSFGGGDFKGVRAGIAS